MNQSVKMALLIGLTGFLITRIILGFTDAPSPYLASLVTGFILFEISFYHGHGKAKNMINGKNL